MGVDRSDYIVYGWKMKYSDDIDYYDDKFQKYLEGHPDVDETLVIDGMCGEYAVFGTYVDHVEDDGDGWEFKELAFEDFDSAHLKELYKELFGTEPEGEPKLMIFSHFS